MKKKLFLFCTFIFATLSISAQSFEDAIYLRNGSIIHGMIIEQIPNIKYKIQTHDGNVYVYDVESIEKITREIPKQQTTIKNSFSHGEKGFFMYLGFDVVPVACEGSCSIDVMAGYRFSNYFALAACTSLGYNYDYNRPLTKSYLHLRSDLLKTKVCPIVTANLGYEKCSVDHNFLLEPGIGLSFPVGTSRMSAGVSYDIFAYLLGFNIGLEF